MRPHTADIKSFDPASLHRILICRINHRLGNALFLTPLITSLNKSLPNCEIDVLLGDAQAAELLSHLPGVGKVYCITQGTSHPAAIWRLLRELRQRGYDLAIDPVSESFGNRLALRLVSAKASLGFQTQDQWAPLTYAVTPVVKHPHAALRPLSLLQYLLPQAYLIQRLTLAIPPEVTQRLAQAWPRSYQAMTIGFFAKPREPRFYRARGGSVSWRHSRRAILSTISFSYCRPREVNHCGLTCPRQAMAN